MSTFNKFGRNYKLTIQGEGLFDINLTLPITIEFDITRHTLSSANVCQIRLYNLSKDDRTQIYFNSFNCTNFRSINLTAGYGNNLSTIFSGNIHEAWSVREGVNYITQIECFDGGFGIVNSQIDPNKATFPAGTPLKVVIASLMSQLQGVTIGSIGNFTQVLSKSNTYSGSVAGVLSELTGGGFFIDQGKAYAIQSDEYVPDLSIPVKIISDKTGLLNTPVIEQSMCRFDMIFEPQLNVGGLISVLSKTNPLANGTYKVTGIKHRGTISAAVCGEAITTGEFIRFKELIPAS